MASLFHSRHVESWQPFSSMAKAWLTQEPPIYHNKLKTKPLAVHIPSCKINWSNISAMMHWRQQLNTYWQQQLNTFSLMHWQLNWIYYRYCLFHMSQSQTLTVNLYMKISKRKSTWIFIRTYSKFEKEKTDICFVILDMKSVLEINSHVKVR